MTAPEEAPDQPPPQPTHVFEGHCPVCETATSFEAHGDWFRDLLLCRHCGSIPRERAFAMCLRMFRPGWRDDAIHESSPAPRAISARMGSEGQHYVGSHYYPDRPLGEEVEGFRNENLERLTFEDGSFDLHCHLDVMEHVGEPELCFREMSRTLRPGGQIIFTTPIYGANARTVRRARYGPDGVEHLAEPEYHGNPIDPGGALVTFHYGRDLPDLIRSWTPEFSVCVVALNDASIGVLGEFREVLVCTKGGGPVPQEPSPDRESLLSRWARHIRIINPLGDRP